MNTNACEMVEDTGREWGKTGTGMSQENSTMEAKERRTPEKGRAGRGPRGAAGFGPWWITGDL